jgi:hypothetical protein
MEWGIGCNASGALAEYKRFIALKISRDDWDSKKQFVPSPQVDKIWHCHLAFTEHYQHDIMAFSVQICGKAHLVQHCPYVSQKEIPHFRAIEEVARYRATFDVVASQDLAEIVGSPVDMRFWPKPETPRYSRKHCMCG